MSLSTVADYILAARTLMQDSSVPYRYSDITIVNNLNAGIGESYRIRPDMWLAYYELDLPGYSAALPNVVVDIPVAFRLGFLYLVVGLTQLADQEDTSDARAGQLIQKFSSTLLTGS